MNEFFFDVSDRWEHQQTQTDARSILTIWVDENGRSRLIWMTVLRRSGGDAFRRRVP
jgi:hypothetical protein